VVHLMDAVVGVDTAIVHLAGAIGASAGLLLPYARDWRWVLREDHLPWYPRIQAYAQLQAGLWGPAVQSLRAELAARIARR